MVPPNPAPPTGLRLRRWLAVQWQDIKGNVKFWLIWSVGGFLFGGSLTQALAFLRHQNHVFWALIGSAILCALAPLAIKLFYPLFARTKRIAVLLGAFAAVAWFWFVSMLSYPTVQILHGNKELENQVIETGGRTNVLNGLIIPSFQVKINKAVAITGMRLYLSEGDARWDGPCLPTQSDEDDFPGEFYCPGFFLSPGEVWNTPEFVVQRNKGVPFSPRIRGRIKVFYGAVTGPTMANFVLRNAF